MRLWSLHPKYLDPQGLVALWREALLARAVLRGETRGYRHHPQLHRFLEQPAPLSAISAYLRVIHDEASTRGYSFDRSKVGVARKPSALHVTQGQLAHEWDHLLAKLAARNPAVHERWHGLPAPDCHPLFELRPGPIADWERNVIPVRPRP